MLLLEVPGGRRDIIDGLATCTGFQDERLTFDRRDPIKKLIGRTR
jgi:hypothetical protein